MDATEVLSAPFRALATGLIWSSILLLYTIAIIGTLASWATIFGGILLMDAIEDGKIEPMEPLHAAERLTKVIWDATERVKRRESVRLDLLERTLELKEREQRYLDQVAGIR